MVTRETIVNYLEGRGSREERTAVEQWLAENPDGLQAYVSEAEWEAFEPAELLPQEASNRYWQRVNKSTSRPAYIVYLKRAAVAASILLAIGACWYFMAGKTGTDQTGVAQTTPAIKEIFNNTSREMQVWLSDSSLVALKPQSRLSYPENFGAAKRTVTLTGEATFTVTKAASQPFVVYNDSVLITVLGTRFTVMAWPRETEMNVHLHQGRVKLSTTGQPFKGTAAALYLQPGDVFTLNKLTRQVAINNSHRPAAAPTGKAGTGGGIKSDNWYMFNNQPLAGVLDQLQQLFNTSIQYNSADVKGMTFIGKVDRTDSLESILSTIALLNNLQLQKQNKGFIISKQ